MTFEFPDSSIGPGQQIKLYIQFDNYKYVGPKVIQARPLGPHQENLSLISSDVGHEGSIGSTDDECFHVYSFSIKNTGKSNTSFNVVGGGVT
jgi:hypothetical protein